MLPALTNSAANERQIDLQQQAGQGKAMKNYDYVETVDNTRHGKLRVKPNPDFGHAKNFNLASVTLAELSACTANYPVVFVKNPDNQQIRPVAMFGLRPGENVFYDKENWGATYVPLIIQRHPFLIGFDDHEEDSTTLTICLDKNSPLLGEDEGIALYTDTGEQTDYLKSRKMLLSELFEGEKIAESFVQKMTEMDLFLPFELIMQPLNDEPRKVTGMYTLDERKLRALSPEQLQELHKLDFLPGCYIIIGSLFQIHELMKLRNQKTGELINYRIDLQPESANEGSV